ncbi:MAG: hypothetical protein D6715_03855 [Calditrichaeota bacterium]|nr:MAG: hypothetical protein D6715_03855 [Calditrichota bacterium]
MRENLTELATPPTKVKPSLRFGLSEWSGAVGDLGTTLPLAFALIVYNGFPVERILFLWGLVYLATGYFYRIPVSVQPLKAMAVLAISLGFSWQQLSTTAFLYGVLFILLASTGMIDRLQRLFTQPLVRGIQLGIGLLLAAKALRLVSEKGFLLNGAREALQQTLPLLSQPLANLLLVALLVVLLWFFQFQKRFPLVLLLIAGGLALSLALHLPVHWELYRGSPVKLTMPEWGFLLNAVVYLIIPQLPLTLGNAVYAAADACHSFWPERAQRVTPRRLAGSIGLSNLAIGLLGGFPICHGAGGIGAHAQFGGKTGGTTIILGSVFVLLALAEPLSSFLFFIPVPILAAMLLADSWRMMSLLQRLRGRFPVVVALVVGGVSFFTRNLTLALLAGILLERGEAYLKKFIDQQKGESP